LLAEGSPGINVRMSRILNVSFYRFTRLRDLPALRDRVKARALAAGLHGSILLSDEGINGFLAGEESILRPYLEWLFKEIPGLAGLQPKESFSKDIPFTRMLVKIKREIITMGRPEIIPSEKTGQNIRATELKRWYDEKKDFVIVDTRNDYEIARGAFKGAIHYDIETFREFPEKLEQEAQNLKDKTVVMYCTGGIRCEKATALALDLGIKDVYQLEGGILKYFEEVGGTHYRGDCFVFDHRSTVDAGLEAFPDKKLKEKTEGLRLFTRSESPASNCVELAIAAKGLGCGKETAETGHSAPVLQRADLVLRSVPTILAYLDENFPETRSLTPDTAERKARMRVWLDWVSEVFSPDAERWVSERARLSKEESHSLEVRLEKHLYRLKTPLQRNRRFLVVDDITQADLFAYAVLKRLKSAEFPRDYPERFDLVWAWMEQVAEAVESGVIPTPKVLRRSDTAIWPN